MAPVTPQLEYSLRVFCHVIAFMGWNLLFSNTFLQLVTSRESSCVRRQALLGMEQKLHAAYICATQFVRLHDLHCLHMS